MTYLLGLASGIVFIALIGASFYAGTRLNKPVRQAAKPPSEDERRKAEQMQIGFDQMMSYTVEKARGNKLE